MCKIHERILRMNIGKRLKQIIIAGLCVLLIGGGVSAVLLRTQIGEVVATAQKWERHKENRGEQFGEKFNPWFEYDDVGEYDNIDDIEDFVQLSKPPLAAKVSLGITGLFGMLLAIAYWILVAAWLYQKAIQADMNGLLWFLLGIGGNFGTVVVFLVVRSILRVKCPSCGKWQKESTFCKVCGSSISHVCPDCGQMCRNTDKYCGSCGRKLEDQK